MEKNNKEIELKKYLFTFWVNSNYDTNKLTELKNSIGIKDDEFAIQIIRKMIKEYATKECEEKTRLTEDEFYKLIIQKNSTKSRELFERLSDTPKDNKDEILEIFENFYKEKEFKNGSISDKAKAFCEKYREKEPNLLKELEEKIKVFKENEKAKKDDENKQYLELCETIKNIIELITHGITEEEGNEKRKFSILDYYEMLGLSYNELNKITGFLSKEKLLTANDMRVIRKFAGEKLKYPELKGNELKEIASQTITFDVEYDKNNEIIIGSGTTISKETMEQFIIELKEKNIPVTQITYRAKIEEYQRIVRKEKKSKQK